MRAGKSPRNRPSSEVVSPQLITILAIVSVLAGAVVPGVPLDAVSLVAVCLLVVGGVLNVTDAAAGFGSTTLVTVACMFVLAEALQRTGAAQGIGRLVETGAERGQRWLLLALLPLVMVLSGIMANTGVVVLLLPILVSAAQRVKISPSRLLLPLSYASITGGTLTLVGTTTTLLVDGLLRQEGKPGLGMFEILPIGAVFCVAAFAYLVVIGPALLPDRRGLLVPLSAETNRTFLTEVVLGPKSRLIGRCLDDFKSLTRRVRALTLVRGEETHWPPFGDQTLAEGDLLLVKGQPQDLIPLMQEPGVKGPPDPAGSGRVTDVNLALAEVMVAPGSRLIDTTVAQAGIRDRFGVVVLAVQRSGAHLREHLGALALRIGDILLVQGEPESIARLARTESDLILLGGEPPKPFAKHKAPWAVGFVGAAMISAALGAPLMIAVIIASLGVVIAGCLNSTQAYRSLDMRILVVLGAMLAVGKAAHESGLAQDVADTLVRFGGQWGERGVLAMIYLATAILTEMVTNAGTASIMVPIALKTADTLEVSHTPFVMAVALAASCAFLTPIGYQTNLLVYGPGGYRLRDYMRLGLPLTLTLWIIASLLLPVIFPFR